MPFAAVGHPRLGDDAAAVLAPRDRRRARRRAPRRAASSCRAISSGDRRRRRRVLATVERDAAVEESDAAHAARVAVDPDLADPVGGRAAANLGRRAVGVLHVALRHARERPGPCLAAAAHCASSAAGSRDEPLSGCRSTRAPLLGPRAGLLLVGRAALRVDALVDLGAGAPRCRRQQHAGRGSEARGPSGNDSAGAARRAVRRAAVRCTAPCAPPPREPRPTPADDPARAVALALLAGFDKHYALFRECARAAKRHFEAGQFLAIGHVARDRIDFYDRRVERDGRAARARVRRVGRRRRRRRGAVDARAAPLRRAARRAPAARVRRDVLQLGVVQAPRTATTSTTARCSCGRRSRPSTSTPTSPPTASYYPRERGLRSALIDLVLDFRLERRFADFRARPRATCSPRFAATCRGRSCSTRTSRSRCCRRCSSATARRTSSGASSTARTSRPFAVSIRHARGRRPLRRRAARRPARARAPVQRQPRVLPRRHGGAVGDRRVPARDPARQDRRPSSTRSSACRSTARRSSSATSCSTCATRPTASSPRRASAAS